LLPSLLNRQHGGIDGGHAHVAPTATVAAEASALSDRVEGLAATGSLTDLLDRARARHDTWGTEGELALLSRTTAWREFTLAVLATEGSKCRRSERVAAHLTSTYRKGCGFDPEIFGI
jgi:hypothetical protein